MYDTHNTMTQLCSNYKKMVINANKIIELIIVISYKTEIIGQ